MALTHSEPLELKWEAPHFDLPDTNGRQYTLADFTDKKGILVVFTCNHCPYAIAAWPLLKELHEKYGQEVGFVAINANDSSMYPEDSFDAMKAEKAERQFDFPYLHDKTQEVAQSYHAQCTPDPYLFKKKDGRFLLYYHGRINDNWQNPEAVTQNNLNNAIKTLIKDEPPPKDQPPSMGCSIKWKG